MQDEGREEEGGEMRVMGERGGWREEGGGWGEGEGSGREEGGGVWGGMMKERREGGYYYAYKGVQAFFVGEGREGR